jgi:HPt (histidine-containing phosphotransfer) domain-containing protein
MRGETLPKRFIFNENIDQQALHDLYADDFMYIEEIFSTILQNFDADFNAIEMAYKSANTQDLKRSVHKMKPIFGFTGLLEIQKSCQQFENQCADAVTITNITEPYTLIKNTMLKARDIIESEIIRLKAFNAS